MGKGVLLLLFLVLVVAEAQLRHGPTASRLTEATPTHLHFYFHDTVSGKSPTAVRVVGPPDASSQSMFGMVNVMDDLLTEGPDAGSPPVGRAQGLYMGSDQAKIGFLQAMNLVFTAGAYNGSTLALLGKNCPLDAVRELPVVGGTGAFRFARGYALLRTHWFDFRTGDATVEYDVYVMH
ncbi:dirigent protein 22-like [Phragmites australis]|uniref:dirigent protein 22-like n=1 Tax=Phragmites australis TaxID=29695 RepID=UPI002D76580E|nr:dirigent protein 22-like [Phragmites australis]